MISKGENHSMPRLLAHFLLAALAVRLVIIRLIRSLVQRLRRKRGKPKTAYNPEQYWNQRGQTFIQEDYQRGLYWQHDWMLDKLHELKPESILEIGCGFGRNLKFLAAQLDHSTKYFGVDFSLPMLFHAKAYLDGALIPLAGADALRLPFPDASFDVVVIHGVFMHIAPLQVVTAAQEARRVAKRHIIQCEQNYSGLQPDAQGVVQINEVTFAHDYARLFAQNGLITVEHRNVKDLDAFFLAKRSAKYDVPESIDPERLFPEY